MVTSLLPDMWRQKHLPNAQISSKQGCLQHLPSCIMKVRGAAPFVLINHSLKHENPTNRLKWAACAISKFSFYIEWWTLCLHNVAQTTWAFLLKDTLPDSTASSISLWFALAVSQHWQGDHSLLYLPQGLSLLVLDLAGFLFLLECLLSTTIIFICWFPSTALH